MGEFIYVPATGMETLKKSELSKYLLETKGFTDTFIFSDSPFIYKNFLISYYYGRQKKSMRKELELADDIFILGDSGGFQNVTQEANLDPLDVLQWQEENCNAGLILDRPPAKRTEMGKFGGNVDNEFFKQCLEETKNNARIMLRAWSNKEMKLYGVIQGDTHLRQIQWFEEMRQVEKDEGIEFSGWALSPKPSTNIEQIAMHVGNLLEHKKTDKPVHVLQISEHESMVVCAYASKFFSSKFTVDSSTWAQQGKIFGEYFDPYHFKNKFLFRDDSDLSIKKGICLCPVCERVEIADFWKNTHPDRKSLSGSLIALHNLYQIIKFAKYLDALKEDEREFREFCTREFNGELDYILDFIYAVGNGMTVTEAVAIYIKKSQTLFSFFEEGTPTTITPRPKHLEKKFSEDYYKEIYCEYGSIPEELATKILLHKYGEG